MPPAASGMSSSYLPRRLGSPATEATAGTSKIVSFQRIQVKQRHASAPRDLDSNAHVGDQREVLASFMCDTRNVGAAVELRNSRSFATESIRFRISSKFAAIVTSLTGCVSSPFSIQNPCAPREKSPVTGLNPKPIRAVTYKPFGVLRSNSSFVIVPGCMIRFDVVGPGLPPMPRPAEPVDARPSLRPEYTSHSTCPSTP